jgi:hypothetical protein
MKGLLHHLPTDDDIANILKEFTVDFLLKGYGTLVQDLHSQLLSNIHVQIDTSHFFWLVTYFLKFATQLELDLEHVSPVLSQEILSYLVFQGVWIYEELEMSAKIPQIDLKPCLRRLHLVGIDKSKDYNYNQSVSGGDRHQGVSASRGDLPEDDTLERGRPDDSGQPAEPYHRHGRSEVVVFVVVEAIQSQHPKQTVSARPDIDQSQLFVVFGLCHQTATLF